ncbi:hypothetical protein [Nocardia sp. CA-290969]|uniref:hypothetical protein n=1 Tax=Nocardia sp. CA-290969 TaxID=3239986 RepID=UPI003D9070A2
MADHDKILYDEAAMQALVDTLNSEGSKIQGQIEALGVAKTNFLNAMGGEGAQSGFEAAYKNAVETKLNDTMQKLGNLRSGVEDALVKAKQTDSKIYQDLSDFA